MFALKLTTSQLPDTISKVKRQATDSRKLFQGRYL